METYAQILLIAIPSFLVLVLIELAYGHLKGVQTYSFMDTLSSLSSGITNILKDSLGIILIIVSYPFVLDHLALYTMEESWVLYLTAFLCIDFAAYWGHRLNHSINVFWNQHIVHHSSEEFNLACALRQSISGLIGYNALFLIPAALLGVPAKVITVLAPLHLFGQFWYHTRHVGKLGWLEYILVTPSQHRVHHAINAPYIDKNLSAIFCIWDRIFGTFQEELDDEPCVFGTLKPVQSWNPIWINFQHLWGLSQDAWYTKKWKDKLKIWFMPTGWRPEDVQQRFPKKIIEQVDLQVKYAFDYSKGQKAFAVYHFILINVVLVYFLSQFGEFTTGERSYLATVLFLSIFGFTSVMDGFKWASLFEYGRSSVGVMSLVLLGMNSFMANHPIVQGILLCYFLTSGLSIYLLKNSIPQREGVISI